MLNRETKHVGTDSTQRQKRGKRILTILLPLFVLFAGIVGFIMMGSLKPKPEDKTEPPKAAPVVTKAAYAETRSLNIETQGEVRPREEINIASQVGGKIIYMSPNLLEGGTFNKGEVLVRIDPSDYALEVTSARASVAQAETALVREKSEADIARRDWEDLGEGTASPLTLREPQLAEARARLLAAQANLEKAELLQSRTIITAPYAGHVRERMVSNGEYITPGQKLARAYGIDVFELKIPLTDQNLSRLGLGIGFKHSKKTPGPTVRLSAAVAGEQQSWEAQLVRIDSAYETTTRLIYGFAEIKNPYAQKPGVPPVAAGMFVDVTLPGKTVESGVVIPRAALRGNDRVFVANADKTLSIKTVQVASSNRENAILLAGLAPGEMVITSPIKGVADGMKVEPTNTNSAIGE